MKQLKNILALLMIGGSCLSASASGFICQDMFKHEEVPWVENAYMDRNAVLTGNLDERVHSLVAKYPENIKYMKDIAIGGMEEHNLSGRRDMVVISTKDMPSQQARNLEADIVKYLGYKTVSFPLTQRGDHLFTRFGGTVFDFWIYMLYPRPYRLEGSERLEAFAVFSEKEQFRFITYLKNAMADHRQVIGPFDFEGALKGDAKLEVNRPCDGVGHNCTSWISTAGIGENGQSLQNILGASPRSDYGRNPGWFSAFLHMRAPKQRVPFTLYVNPQKSLQEIVGELQESKKLSWDFAPQ